MLHRIISTLLADSIACRMLHAGRNSISISRQQAARIQSHGPALPGGERMCGIIYAPSRLLRLLHVSYTACKPTWLSLMSASSCGFLTAQLLQHGLQDGRVALDNLHGAGIVALNAFERRVVDFSQTAPSQSSVCWSGQSPITIQDGLAMVRCQCSSHSAVDRSVREGSADASAVSPAVSPGTAGCCEGRRALLPRRRRHRPRRRQPHCRPVCQPTQTSEIEMLPLPS